MPAINPYLNFNGTTEEAFNFYRSVFGGEFTYLQRFRDVPGCGPVAEADLDKIMHISLPIGQNVLMATDALESMGQKLQTGNNYYISVTPESREETDRIFNALSEGGKVEMPMEDAFWGDYFGSFIDKFGVGWMLNYSNPK